MSHVAPHPEHYPGEIAGDGHCVALVRRACAAPPTACWRQGAHALSSDVAKGTAIATFDEAGRYASATDGHSHAAIYIEPRGGGFLVLDQWLGRPATYRVVNDRNGVGPAADDASRFHVIET
jgi:hypothetical protein